MKKGMIRIALFSFLIFIAFFLIRHDFSLTKIHRSYCKLLPFKYGGIIKGNANLSVLEKNKKAVVTTFYPSETKEIKKTVVFDEDDPHSYTILPFSDLISGEVIQKKLAPWYIAQLDHAYLLGNENVICTKDRKLLRQSICSSFLHPKTKNEICTHPLKKQLPKIKRCKKTAAVISVKNHEINNYYHWMVQVFPRLLILQESGLHYDRIYLNHTNLSFQLETFKALKIDLSKIKPIRNDTLLQINKMILPLVEVHNFVYKDQSIQETFVPNHRLVAEKLHEVFQVPRPLNGTRRIYISRKDAPTRRITNEEELFPLLEKAGFECIALEPLSVREKLALFAEAEIVIGYFGAGFTHVSSCPQNARVIELIPYELNFEDFAVNYSEMLQECGLLTQRRLVRPDDDGLPASTINRGAKSAFLAEKDLLPFLDPLLPRI